MKKVLLCCICEKGGYVMKSPIFQVDTQNVFVAIKSLEDVGIFIDGNFEYLDFVVVEIDGGVK